MTVPSELYPREIVAIGDWQADLLHCRVHRDDEDIRLTHKETLLLRYLLARANTPVSRHDLLREVWEYETATTRTLDVHISTLRHKIERDTRAPRFILTIRGFGYMLATGEFAAV